MYGWVEGLLVIGSHGILNGDSTMPHSISLSILLKVHHPQPDNEPESRALPRVGVGGNDSLLALK